MWGHEAGAASTFTLSATSSRAFLGAAALGRHWRSVALSTVGRFVRAAERVCEDGPRGLPAATTSLGAPWRRRRQWSSSSAGDRSCFAERRPVAGVDEISSSGSRLLPLRWRLFTAIFQSPGIALTQRTLAQSQTQFFNCGADLRRHFRIHCKQIEVYKN